MSDQEDPAVCKFDIQQLCCMNSADIGKQLDTPCPQQPSVVLGNTLFFEKVDVLSCTVNFIMSLAIDRCFYKVHVLKVSK